MIESAEKIIILDFGSQYTQLIARVVRELGVYSLILPYNTTAEIIRSHHPTALILSGGPQSVYHPSAPTANHAILDLDLPILGICYGFQWLSQLLGGSVAAASRHEYGLVQVKQSGSSVLFTGLPRQINVWMSHGDHIAVPPPDWSVTALSNSAIAAAENRAAKLFGLQFHPEVVHTTAGRQILQNFLIQICGLKCAWSPQGFISEAVAEIKRQVKSANVICALSGGVDSSVAAALVDRAIGRQQTCLFVDNGLLRRGEYEEVLGTYKHLGLNVRSLDVKQLFLNRLKQVFDPERKRKIIGQTFIEIFEQEARQIGGVQFLVQGTLYPDVIESVSTGGPSATIKSHHNVGGLPADMRLKLVEPLRHLFKDEVRLIGRQLGLPSSITSRQAFPGPGLAVRILGAVTDKRLALLQAADAIIQDEIKLAGWYDRVYQSFGVLLPISTVGVMGDARTYENVLALRVVDSTDIMTVDWSQLPYQLLQKISSRITSEVRGINRVVYDITSKPPATVEWE